jgi:hypothetical protein
MQTASKILLRLCGVKSTLPSGTIEILGFRLMAFTSNGPTFSAVKGVIDLSDILRI